MEVNQESGGRTMSTYKRYLFRFANAKELILITGLLVLVVAALLAVTFAGMGVLSSVRAYVHGGALYAKAQKDAVHYLNLYAQSHQEEHFEKYRDAIAVPMGMRQARVELETPRPDLDRINEGLRQGRLEGSDLPDALWAFRALRAAEPLRQAHRLWTEADLLVAQLDNVADRIRDEVRTPAPDDELISSQLQEVERLNMNLSTLETAFSQMLSDLGQRVQQILFWSVLGTALLFFVLALIPSRRILAQLKSSQEKFRRLFDQAHDAIILINPDGDVTYANPAAFRLFGYAPDAFARGESIAQRLEEFCVRPGDFRAFFVTLQHDGSIRDAEFPLRRLDGEVLDCVVTATLIRGRGGEPVGYEVIIRDVTKRKRTEERLRLLERAVEASGNALIISDATRPGFPLVYVNPAFEQMTGYPAREAVGQPFDFVVGEHATPSQDDLRRAMHRGETCRTTLRNVRKDGTAFWYELSLAPVFNADGRLVNYVGIQTDVTETKQAEETLRNALAKEKELSELQSRFVSMASHEFRTPLAAILSSAELVERFRHKWDEARVVKHLRRIQSSVLALTNLLENVLIIGRVDVGKLSFEPERTDLRALCREVIEDVWLGFGEGRRLEMNLSEDPIRAEVDTTLVRYIVTNLLSNAAKYSDPGSRVTFDLIHEEDRSIIRVSDEGIGIPEEDLRRVFTPFHRASNAETIPGTGLGLSIVKRAVELHGGAVSLRSTQGRGTTISVSLPAELPEEAVELNV